VAQSASRRYLSTIYYWSSERDGVWIWVSSSLLQFFWISLSKRSLIFRDQQRSPCGNYRTSLQLTEHLWSATMCDIHNTVPAATRETQQPSCSETCGHIVSFLRGWLQNHPPHWILIKRCLSKCGPGIKYNLISSTKLYREIFPDLNFINITTRIIIVLIFTLP